MYRSRVNLPATSCVSCGRSLPLLAADPLCACGGVAAIPALAHPAPGGDAALHAPHALWRWRSALPYAPEVRAARTLGEGPVPLEPLLLPGLRHGVLALRDDLQPTGSWKDRGAALLAAAIAARGITDIVEDSSGNAALALAHYARLWDLNLTAYVPSSATALKKSLIAGAGARLVEVDGPREAATGAARGAVAAGAFYASHAAQPLHPAGAATAAFNIVEELGRVPGAVVLPLGQGGYLAGLFAGFRALGAMPRLCGVQSSRCAPLWRALAAGSDTADAWKNPPDAAPGGLAEGVLNARPARDREALAAVRESGGTIAALDDLAVERTLRLLWREGFRVEPTSALAVAFLLDDTMRRVLDGVHEVVVILTGHGVREGRALVEGIA